MANLVIDASITVAWCLPDERSDYAEAVLDVVLTKLAVAPRLWAYEVRNTILMAVRRQRITRADAITFLTSLRDFDIYLVDPPSYAEVYELAEVQGLTFYDAAYLDLALREGAAIATADQKLQTAAKRVGVQLWR